MSLGLREAMQGVEPIVERARVINVTAGDVFVIECDYISRENAQFIKRHFESHFPDNKCIVLGEGARLNVFRPTDLSPVLEETEG